MESTRWAGSARAAWSLRASIALVLMAGACASIAQVSIGGSGNPSYSHPIAVPPGISGMQPNLSLMYAGGGANGPVGHGWSVQGISMITRCPSTRYTDGAVRGVKFDASDKLCLDGQRLIQTNSTGSTSGIAQVDDARGVASGVREYRTEKDSFARIRAYGMASGSDANGPAYFKVWTKAGQVYEYGAGPASNASTNASITAEGKNVVMVWAVARISDVVGNYMDFRYELRTFTWGSGPVGSTKIGREWNVSEIHYTGNSSNGQAPSNKVTFRYSDRAASDRAEAWQLDSKNLSVRLLDGIDSYTGTVKVRSTNLTYDASGVTKRSRLATITECAGAATPVCQPATRFSYSNGGSEQFVANGSFNLMAVPLHEDNGSRGVEVADFNGDGRTDILRWSDNSPPQNALFLSNGDGTFSQVPNGTAAGQFNITDLIFSDGGCVASLVMDFNADGLPDIFRYASKGVEGLNCGSDPTYLYINNGNGSFTRQTVTGVSLVKNVNIEACGFEQDPCTYPRADTFYVLDVDGDGYPDVIKTWLPERWSTDTNDPCAASECTQFYKGNGTGAFTLQAAPANVRNKSLFQWPGGESGNRALAQQRYVADVDGDGLLSFT